MVCFRENTLFLQALHGTGVYVGAVSHFHTCCVCILAAWLRWDQLPAVPQPHYCSALELCLGICPPPGSDSGEGPSFQAHPYSGCSGITEWRQLEGSWKNIFFQCSCHGKGRLPLEQIAQSPTQPGFEHFEGQGIHKFSGLPVPVLHSEELLPDTCSNSAFCQFKAILSCPIPTHS